MRRPIERTDKGLTIPMPWTLIPLFFMALGFSVTLLAIAEVIL